MKIILINLIKFYKSVISPFINQLFGFSAKCRYGITCSQYALESIEKHGVIRGSFLSVKRILSCQPFNKELKLKANI
jgi:uncharacterized protein